MAKRKRKRKNPAAVSLGKRGGKKRTKNLTAEERSDSARRAVNIRWERKRKAAFGMMGRRTRFVCVECGKDTAGRMPRDGRHVGDGTGRFPRRHKGKDGLLCKGNTMEAVWKDFEESRRQV